MKRILFIILFILSSNLYASEMTNEWGGTNWPYYGMPGKFTITKLPVTDQTNIGPLSTNVIIQKLSLRNSIGATNTYPFLSAIIVHQIGTANDSDIARVHVYFDTNGIWDGDEQEFRTNVINNTNTGSKFPKDYSPTTFENGVANYGAVVSDEVGLHLPWRHTWYFYVTIDTPQNITDKAIIDTRIYALKMFMNVNVYWEQNMANIDTDINARLNVTATRFVIEGEPPPPGINVNTPFNLTIKAVDGFGNIDKEFTGTIWFTSTDPSAVLPYTSSSPYTFTLADEGVKVFSNFRLLSGPKENIYASDGAGGLLDGISDDIIVLSDVDHFKLIGDGTNLPADPTITAGVSLSNLGVTNITAVAYNYLSSIISSYTGYVYFESSVGGQYDQYPADVSNRYQFTGTGGDDGSHDFPASQFILTKAGKQNLIVTDGVHSGEWLNITVQPAAYSKLIIECETNVTAGSYFNLKIQATDPYENLVSGTSTDLSLEIERLDNVTSDPVNAVLPPLPLSLSGGEVNLEEGNRIKINEGGIFKITVTDINTPNITVSENISVTLRLEKGDNSAVAYNYIHPENNRSVDLYYDNKTAGSLSVDVEIYTISGKLVKKFTPQATSPGINRLLSWDITNDGGERVKSGVYIVLVKGGAKEERHFVVVVR
ncbi:MAG: T9SS type A sorting domain-containing protein [Spirochaetes bacterium]|nr:T9SS type A sorting domain-containing protein [Spirochaetota bacterium]